MNELVSIIVPIYNSEKYIGKCIDSIINQTYKNIEILLINDGSLDNTLNIARSFKDKRIIIIDKENTGVSDTRNVGIKEAQGDYIAFVDSDDWIDKNYIYWLLSDMKNNNSDIVISGFNKIKDNSTTHKVLNHKIIDMCNKINNTKILYELLYSYNGAAMWSKLYKTNIIKDLTMKKIKIGEDMLFNIECFQNCRNICISSYCGYNYYINESSVTNKYIPYVFHDLDNILSKTNITPIIYIYTLRIFNEVVTNTYIHKDMYLFEYELKKTIDYQNVMFIVENISLYNRVKNIFSLKRRIYNNVMIYCLKKQRYRVLFYIKMLKYKKRTNNGTKN